MSCVAGVEFAVLIASIRSWVSHRTRIGVDAACAVAAAAWTGGRLTVAPGGVMTAAGAAWAGRAVAPRANRSPPEPAASIPILKMGPVRRMRIS